MILVLIIKFSLSILLLTLIYWLALLKCFIILLILIFFDLYTILIKVIFLTKFLTLLVNKNMMVRFSWLVLYLLRNLFKVVMLQLLKKLFNLLFISFSQRIHSLGQIVNIRILISVLHLILYSKLYLLFNFLLGH